ncbi:hypothetical protein BAY61_14570 [Prauserella marina]|nr:hypothetical protein [Prauserella marina]ASR36023.1 hypothetical protein BAY61_14570 [Prauserella marina]
MERTSGRNAGVPQGFALARAGVLFVLTAFLLHLVDAAAPMAFVLLAAEAVLGASRLSSTHGTIAGALAAVSFVVFAVLGGIGAGTVLLAIVGFPLMMTLGRLATRHTTA